MQIQQPMQTFATKQTSAETAAESDSARPPSNAAVSHIASIIAEQAPAPQPAAIAEHEAQARKSELTDKNGAKFDDAIHVRDADGKPRQTARGTWQLKRGRKPGPQSAQSHVASAAPVTPLDVQQRTAGVHAANLMVTVGMTVGGEEWAPRVLKEYGLDEMANLEKAFGDYFVAKKMTDVPPGVALAIAVLGYAGPRFFAPQTKARVSAASSWIGEKAAKIYRWFTGRKKVATPQELPIAVRAA